MESGFNGSFLVNVNIKISCINSALVLLDVILSSVSEEKEFGGDDDML